MTNKKSQISNSANLVFSSLLLIAIVTGGVFGFVFPEQAVFLKPIAKIFINFILILVVPLIFFNLSSAICELGKSRKEVGFLLAKIFLSFLLTSTVAAIFMLFVVTISPPIVNISLPSTTSHFSSVTISEQIVNTISAPDFNQLLSHHAILPIIIFSILIGLSTTQSGKLGLPLAKFLKSGAAVSMQAIAYIMYFAPIGFFAYFAALIAETGSSLITKYLHLVSIYYTAGIFYFFIFFTFFVFCAKQKSGVLLFWKNILISALTSLGTCSSVASIPANLQAVKNMGISNTIGKTIVPLGAVLHKDGSVLGAILKIAFLFSLLHLNFSGIGSISLAVGVSLLVGTIMGAIPSGGMLGEVLILSMYNLNPELLLLIMPISLLIEPLATMLNVTGDCVCAILVTSWTETKYSTLQEEEFNPKITLPESEV